MKFSIVYKLSLSIVFIVLVSAGLVGGLFYSKTSDLLVNEALNDISAEIFTASSRLLAHIEAQSEDVLFLSNTPPIQGMLRAHKANAYDKQGKSSYRQWVQRQQSIFTTMLASKPNYMTLRFIDKRGQELVVVGREGGKLVVARDEQLQNKAHRAYVKETIKLPAKSIYFSEINLNREHGAVSLPHREVLRSATPVYDDQTGEVEGLLLITAEIGHQLREIQNDIHDEDSKIYITNDHGGYLLHPEARKGYGFDLGKRYRIQEDIPQLVNMFLPDNQKSNFILLPEESDGKHVVNFAKVPFDPGRPERFIAVGITQLHSKIVAQQSVVLNELLLPALTLVLAITLLGVLFSLRLTRPIKDITRVMDDYTHQRKSTAIMPNNRHDEIGVLAQSFSTLMEQVDEAQTDLKEMNNNLEVMVELRTQALEASEVRQRTVLETIADAIITIDDKGIINSFNPAAEQIFGYTVAEAVGNNFSILMSSDERQAIEGRTNNSPLIVPSIINNRRDLEGLRKNGSVFPLELKMAPMTVDGEQGFVGILRDITERQKTDKMKNEFISTVSHELRTPLTSIRASLGLIAQGVVGEIPDEALGMLNIAGNNTERLLLLINDILDIQKIEAGQMSLKFQNLELMPFLQRAIQDNAGYGEEHNVKFVLSNELADSRVYADRDRLMQVMANLLSNAAKFSPDGETVEISVARHKNDSLRISVTDHGPGVPEEFQPKLFLKFTQSDASDTRQKGGTGLGLNISKAIIEKHGGHIDFVTHEGIGSTFYIELPELIGEVITDDPRQLTGEHIPCVLIVEDDPDVAALLKRMLAEAGYNSDIAYNANQARQLLQEKADQYKAITLDLVLPGDDGISLLDDLHSDASSYNIPVVVVSVKANETKRDLQGGAVGVVDWLQKPIDQQRLINAVKKAAGPTRLAKVLHVEDEADVHKVVSMMLRDHCDLTWATTKAASIEALESEDFDLVLLDIGLPDGSGLDLLDTIEHCVTPPRVVIFSAYDVTQEYADKVSAVLVKSRTDEFRLAEVIDSVINPGKKS